MKITLLLIPIVFFIGSYRRYKKIHNPYTAFNLLWAIIGYLTLVGNQYIFEPDNTALLVVIIGIVAFNFSMFSPKIVIKRNGIKYNDGGYNYVYKENVALILSVIVLILSAVQAIRAIQSVFSGANFSEIRSEYFTYTSATSVWAYYFRNYIITPLRYVTIICTIISVFKERKINKVLLINTALIVVLQAISSGSRYVLMNTVFMFICGFFVFGNRQRMPLKKKIVLVFVIVLFSYVVIFLTNDRTTLLNQRMTTVERLSFTVHEYFAGSLTYLGKVVEKNPQIVGSTYGLNFIAGFITPVFVVLTFLHLIPYPKIFNVIGTYACEMLRIGPSTYYNAMPTIFGYFYIDGGFILLIIEAWLFGYICNRLYARCCNDDLLCTAFYILVFIQICNSSTRWFFFTSEYCFAFIYMHLVIRKEKKLV